MNSQREQVYRPIQPASLSSLAAAGYYTSVPPVQTVIPKKRSVFRACFDCRKAKIKCDGVRPKCGPCFVKNRSCGYDTNEASSQLQSNASATAPTSTSTSAASVSRLQALEMLIDLLQKSPSDQAAQLLQRIRASSDPVAMLDALGESPAAHSPTSDTFNARDHLERWLRSQDPSDYSIVPGCSNSTSGSVLSDQDTNSSSNPTSASSLGRTQDDEMDDGRAMECPPLVMKPSLGFIQHAIPSASMTQQSLDTFFICSGRLLHVFSREQGARHFNAVYNSQKSPAEASPVDLGCLMSLASVGAQYMCGTFGKEVEEAFYEIGKYYLDEIIQQQPLEALKVCSLLAIYNIMGKATVSLAYVEIGLGLCRRFGLNSSSGPHPTFTEDSWVDYRKAWRSLMFLSSWLSTTLGYISGNDSHDDRVSLSELYIEDPRNTSDVVQTEIAKICVLKANILRVHLAVNDITTPALQSIVQDLQDWYTDLPPEMRLDCTGRDDLELETKRSISHIHLHYLGAIMLLYSRIASQFMQPLRDWALMPRDLKALLEKLAGEAVIAARTSSRVLWLLYEEHSIFKRCWLVIFQAYTSCLVLLHSAAQKQLHDFSAESLMEDIQYIKDSLAILYYCGELDQVAASFHTQLKAALNDILERGAPMHGSMGARMDGASPRDFSSGFSEEEQQSFAYLLTVPAHADMPHVNLSMSLLSRLCRPFGHPSTMIIGPSQANNISNNNNNSNNSLEEIVPQTRTWSKWGADPDHSFQWDMDLLLSHGTSTTPDDAESYRDFMSPDSCGRWLGSLEPSGWMPAAPIREGVR